jgi:tryptophanyl-tRNA synthetase
LKKRLFSGSAPTGSLTLGNYLGALKGWSQLQEEYDALFSVVDLHALTLPRDSDLLRKRTLDFLCLYLACGIDPDKSTLFIQSHNPHHSELAWMLGCQTSFGELCRMTQFKSKSSQKDGSGAGLLNYPVLMAADILLYGTHLVPVGEDQKQHLELTRTLAERFNRRYEKIFPLPQAFIPPQTGRVMNLLDPTSKMDKSHENPGTYIALLDTPEVICKKISRAKTDGLGDFNLENRESGIGNLVRIYGALTGLGENTVVWEYEYRGYGALKKDLGEIISESLKPIRENYSSLRSEENYLRRIIEQGRMKSREKSEPVMGKVKQIMGLIT